MIESGMYLMNSGSLGYGLDISGRGGEKTSKALHLFRRAAMRGWWLKGWSALSGRSNRLLDLEEVKDWLDLHSGHYAGVKAVAIEAICGTEGKSEDFDRGFNPLREAMRDRWLSVARARLSGIALPPVELTRVGERYFVRDGHHRISVAKALGETAIDAVVTVID